MYWKSFTDDNGFIYSLDNVRLNLDFGSPENASKITHLMEHVDTYSDQVSLKFYHSLRNFTYRYLYTLSSGSVSFTVGVGFLGTGKEQPLGFLDFNPNKVQPVPVLSELLQKVLDFSFSAELVRYDLAIDMPFSRSSCKLIRQGKKLYTYMIKDDGVTEYSGRRSHSGFIKLYDKTIESGLDFPLTRLEITLDKSADLESFFPEVWIYDTQNSLLLSQDLSNTQKVLVDLIRQSEIPSSFFCKLDRMTRAKIRPYCTDKVLALYSPAWFQVKSLAFSYEK